jgi:hypothetical protein
MIGQSVCDVSVDCAIHRVTGSFQNGKNNSPAETGAKHVWA